MNQIYGGTEIIREIEKLYQSGQTDYTMEPLVLIDKDNNPVGTIRDKDSVIFCCRRGEREVQLTRAFVDPAFNEFPRAEFKNLKFVTLTLYHEMFLDMPVDVAFPPHSQIKDTLGETISKNGLRQLRVAESEKFAHVTFFMNGGLNDPYPGEDDICVPSPEGVSYEEVPELSVAEVARQTVKGIHSGNYDFIAVNLANGDIIGHFESPEPKIKCAQVLDKHLGIIIEQALGADYVTLITADHGLLELSKKQDGNPNTSHTRNPVPLVMVSPNNQKIKGIGLRKNGKLMDIAPTILQLMGIPQPDRMSGQSILGSNSLAPEKRKVLLLVIDGWGIGSADSTNPIFLAHTPVWDSISRKYPSISIEASGKAVGLEDWKPGNSEAGHMNIGAGRAILQDDVRISNAIQDGSFYRNSALLDAIENVCRYNSTLHLICLLSRKSSHGSIDYPLAILKLAKDHHIEKVCIHAVFDGRSTKVREAPALLNELSVEMERIGIGRIVSGVGRSLALDRNNDYGKTQKAYNSLVFGLGRHIRSV